MDTPLYLCWVLLAALCFWSVNVCLLCCVGSRLIIVVELKAVMGRKSEDQGIFMDEPYPQKRNLMSLKMPQSKWFRFFNFRIFLRLLLFRIPVYRYHEYLEECNCYYTLFLMFHKQNRCPLIVLLVLLDRKLATFMLHVFVWIPVVFKTPNYLILGWILGF